MSNPEVIEVVCDKPCVNCEHVGICVETEKKLETVIFNGDKIRIEITREGK